jgi:hypothetical protein
MTSESNDPFTGSTTPIANRYITHSSNAGRLSWGISSASGFWTDKFERLVKVAEVQWRLRFSSTEFQITIFPVNMLTIMYFKLVLLSDLVQRSVRN